MEAVVLLISKAFVCVAIVSGVPLITTSLVGLIVAVLQATTQIQEQSFMFLVKISTISLLFFLGGTYLLQYIIAFFNDVLTSFAYFGALT
jgi:flagellar biosynthesis protein FliQ